MDNFLFHTRLFSKSLRFLEATKNVLNENKSPLDTACQNLSVYYYDIIKRV